MGGRMTYQRFRTRNGLMNRAPVPSEPYIFEPGVAERFRNTHMDRNDYVLNGDLNRMEWGYTDPDSPYSDALEQVVEHTGVDAETVRKVLRYVFFEQR